MGSKIFAVAMKAMYPEVWISSLTINHITIVRRKIDEPQDTDKDYYNHIESCHLFLKVHAKV